MGHGFSQRSYPFGNFCNRMWVVYVCLYLYKYIHVLELIFILIIREEGKANHGLKPEIFSQNKSYFLLFLFWYLSQHNRWVSGKECMQDLSLVLSTHVRWLAATFNSWGFYAVFWIPHAHVCTQKHTHICIRIW